MAAEEGIDLSLVPGTGIGGRVSKRDWQRYLEPLRQTGTPGSAPSQPANGAAQAPSRPTPTVATPPQTSTSIPAPSGPGFRPPVYQPVEGDIVEPFTPRRKLIAEHMAFSKTHSPHAPPSPDADVTNALHPPQLPH